MLNHRQIAAFRAVMLSGGVTAAARMLHVTQPAVSRLIGDLEAVIGLQLFERRSGGRLRPTGDAVILYREVNRYFVGLDQIGQVASELAHRRIGSLRVASLPALYIGLLPKFIGKFLASRPELDLQLFGTSSETVIDWVSSGRCDIGFVDPPFEHPSIVRRPLPRVSAVAVIPVGHRLADRAVLRPEDFAQDMFISIARATQLRVRVDAFFLTEGVVRRMGHETPLSMLACSLVAAGAGLSIIDPFTAQAFREDTVLFKPVEPSIDVQFSIISAANTPIRGAALDFIEEIEDEIERFRRDVLQGS